MSVPIANDKNVWIESEILRNKFKVWCSRSERHFSLAARFTHILEWYLLAFVDSVSVLIIVQTEATEIGVWLDYYLQTYFPLDPNIWQCLKSEIKWDIYWPFPQNGVRDDKKRNPPNKTDKIKLIANCPTSFCLMFQHKGPDTLTYLKWLYF